jgi:hypothetical protein
VLLRETKSLAELRNPSTPPSPREEMLRQTIDRLIAIMSSFAGMTPYISEFILACDRLNECLIFAPQEVSVMFYSSRKQTCHKTCNFIYKPL